MHMGSRRNSAVVFPGDRNPGVVPISGGGKVPISGDVVPISGASPSDDLRKKDVQKKVAEYALPATVQTHEVAAPVGRSDLILITQQECNSVITVRLNPQGSPVSAVKSAVRGKRYDGVHGNFPSKVHPGDMWLTLQFSHELLRIDAATNEVRSTIPLPPPLKGPHTLFEDDQYLWVACKHSHHVARVHQYRPNDDVRIYQCSRRPICIVKTNTHVYATLDQSSMIFSLDLSTYKCCELHIPADKGATPVGLIAQPDGKAAWFVLLGGLGTFGCIIGKDISFYQLNIALGATAGLIHLAFDETTRDPSNVRLWLLASSLAKGTGGHSHQGAHEHPPKEVAAIDALFTVVMEPASPCSCGDNCRCDPCTCSHASNPMRIVSEETVMLPTQPCLAHRVLRHGKGVFVTELGVSALARITGNVFLGGHDEATDNYALWGLGITSDHIDYVNQDDSNKRPRVGT